MSTIYSWTAELAADATGAAGDWCLVYDTSAGRTKKARLVSAVVGGDPAKVVPFYGETGVDQGTFTATALTALATATVSAAQTATVFGFGSSTVAKAYVKRMSQIQADLETLMGKLDSTGIVAIAGLS